MVEGIFLNEGLLEALGLPGGSQMTFQPSLTAAARRGPFGTSGTYCGMVSILHGAYISNS